MLKEKEGCVCVTCCLKAEGSQDTSMEIMMNAAATAVVSGGFGG
jgi:hypothetical protein